MANLNVLSILNKVYGAKGIPFPKGPLGDNSTAVAGPFTNGVAAPVFKGATDRHGTPVKLVTDAKLGQYVFMPVTINGYQMPNPLIIISGEKMLIETDLVEVGTVYEKVFTKPYDISVICTLVGENDEWPEVQLGNIVDLWQTDEIVTLACALTDLFLQPDNNFIITKISILDNNGAENVEVVQIDGKSNVDFTLNII